jgi:YegS/Rv2252/BmrU family lipid kinase
VSTQQQNISTKTVPAIKCVHVIINPAAGQDEPILKPLNTVFNELNIEWEAFVTKDSGDARRFARESIEAGVDAIAAYGGDGTVLEVASGMTGSEVPLVILPGGTANVLSVELGIPRDLVDAISLINNPETVLRPLDMGKSGDQLFFHLGMGLESNMIEGADREAKDQSGMLAYIKSALKEIRNPPTAHYRMKIDGELVEADGVSCMITTFGSIGVAGLKLSHDINMSDGLLDVLVIRDIDLKSLLSAAADAITSGDIAAPLLQWQAREIEIVADPPQKIVCDGDPTELTDVKARIVPGAVWAIVPAATLPDRE